MKNAFVKLINNIADLFKIKSLVTLGMTFVMIYMLMNKTEVPTELLALFSTAYGSVITYFFTKSELKNE